MRPIGTLECRDCGQQHEIHLNRAGQLVPLIACPASERGHLRPMAQQQIKERLHEARHQLGLADQMLTGDRVNWTDLVGRLDEIHRELVRAQNTIGEHLEQAR